MPCSAATPAGRDPRNPRGPRTSLPQWVRSTVRNWTGQHLAEATASGDAVKAALCADLTADLPGAWDAYVNDALAVVNAR